MQVLANLYYKTSGVRYDLPPLGKHLVNSSMQDDNNQS